MCQNKAKEILRGIPQVPAFLKNSSHHLTLENWHLQYQKRPAEPAGRNIYIFSSSSERIRQQVHSNARTYFRSATAATRQQALRTPVPSHSAG